MLPNTPKTEFDDVEGDAATAATTVPTTVSSFVTIQKKMFFFNYGMEFDIFVFRMEQVKNKFESEI